MKTIVLACALSTATFAQDQEWRMRSINAPPSRVLPAMTYDSARGRTVLFGGGDGRTYPTETWEYDGQAWTQVATVGPVGRIRLDMCYDSVRHVTFVFGGSGSPGLLNDTWTWNGVTWTQHPVTGPSPRNGHTMAFDSRRGVVVLFGGNDQWSFFGQTWEWDGGSWTQRQVAGPPARANHGMAFDEARGVTVLFGGTNSGRGDGTGVLRDTWEWDGSTWSLRSQSGPSARENFAIAYNSDRHRTVIFGGFASNLTSETWEWDGTSWAQLPASGPSATYQNAMAYDSARHVAVMFGGSQLPPEIWELTPRCPRVVVTQQPTDQNVNVGAPVTFVVAAQAVGVCTSPVHFRWQRRNPLVANESSVNAWIDLEDGIDFLNTTTAGLIILTPRPALATGYRCKISGGCGCEPFPDPFVPTDTVNFTVACPADFNADGGVDFSDVEAFFERWENGC